MTYNLVFLIKTSSLFACAKNLKFDNSYDEKNLIAIAF